MKIPAVVLKGVNLIRRTYWWLVRPITIGVRAVIVNSEGSILLVKHSYQPGWYLPGGKLGRGESILDGLKRELRQEVGLSLPQRPNKILGVYSNFSEFKSDHVIVFVVKDWEMKNKGHFEIAEKQFFLPSNLPNDCSPATKRRIAEYAHNGSIDFSW
jgi:ADP-ribose pyrophosphatase YjhB (NUDIX family)